MIIVIFVAVVATQTLVSGTPSDKETARIRISQKGLDFGEDVAFYMIEILQKVAVGKLTLPKIANSQFEATNMKFSKLRLGKPELSFEDNAGIKLKQKTAKIQVRGDWAIKTLWWNYGHLSLDADLSIDAIAGIAAKNGKFMTVSRGCSVRFNSFSLNLHRSLFTWIAGLMEASITPAIKNAVCTEINKVLRTEINTVIKGIPHSIPVADIMNVEIEADSNPVINKSHFDISARIKADGQTKDVVFPFQPELMSDPTNPAQMACFLLSDYTLNTASYVALAAGKIKESVPNAQIPATSPFLNTDFYKTTVPALSLAYPNTVITFAVTNTRYPRIEFDMDLISLNMPVSLTATPAGAGIVLKLNIDLTVEGTVRHDNNILSGAVTSASHTVDVISSTIGDVAPSDIETVINSILENTVIPEINKTFNKGISIPVDKYFTLDEGVVEAHDDFLKVCADITLTEYSLKELKKIVEDIV